MSKTFKYLFGPVPSRRLGRSLGVDLVPYKTCSFDCVFCQVAPTTTKTLERKEYVPVADVIDELGDWLETEAVADYITLSGSGEPTLHAAFGQVIDFVEQKTDIPVAILTNGSLFSDTEVREQAAKADLVKVSLSGYDEASMEKVDRPHPDIDFDYMIEGYERFRNAFSGEMRLEVFLLSGINDAPEQVTKIARLAKRVRPDRIELNTVVRPSSEAFAKPVPSDRMNELAQYFEPQAEVVSEGSGKLSTGTRIGETEIFHLVQRRPCTLEQICEVFDVHRNEASKYLGELMRAGKVQQQTRGSNGEVYYRGL